MSKPRTRISLESASKEELITAIRKECSFGQTIDRIEMHIYYDRCDSLIGIMTEAVDVMDRNRQTGATHNEAKRRKWAAAHRKWSRANTQLEELQARDTQ